MGATTVSPTPPVVFSPAFNSEQPFHPLSRVLPAQFPSEGPFNDWNPSSFQAAQTGQSPHNNGVFPFSPTNPGFQFGLANNLLNSHAVEQPRGYMDQPTRENSRLPVLKRLVGTTRVSPKGAALPPPNTPIPAFRPTNFEPTLMAEFGRGVQRDPTPAEQAMRAYTGMAGNYRGDPGNIFHHSFKWLPDEQNCSFWIVLLPSDVTEHQLLGAIRNCGNIYAIHINKEDANLHWRHAAAKVMFITQEGATNFSNQYMHDQSLIVDGKRVRITRNRTKTPEHSRLSEEVSRCVRVRGPPNIVDAWYLIWCFEQCFHFEIDEIITHSSSEYLRDLEIRFGSFRAQAQFAVKVLTTEKPFIDTPDLFVAWELDPCSTLPPNHMQWPRPVTRG